MPYNPQILLPSRLIEWLTQPNRRLALTCPKCRIKMVEKKRSYHKNRKWVCPGCGAARMQAQKPRLPKGKGVSRA